MIQGFKEFISRGNVIDLAVAVVIGAAFGAIVSSVVDAVINPEETRAYIAHALKVSRNKSETRPARKHGIPPL